MTVLELANAILRKSGSIASGETLRAEALKDCIESINLLLEEWHNIGLIALPQKQTFNVVANIASYTIGPAMTWAGSKPLKITAAHLTLDDVDYPLSIIGDNEYMSITEKAVEETPTVLYYLPSESTGTVYLVGVPDQSYTITILSNKTFTAYSESNVSATVSLPDGYKSALIYNSALEIWHEYEKSDPPMLLVKRAKETLEAIRRTNLKKAAPMQLDGPFCGDGSYSFETDSFS
jgi:hypothetical protein